MLKPFSEHIYELQNPVQLILLRWVGLVESTYEAVHDLYDYFPAILVIYLLIGDEDPNDVVQVLQVIISDEVIMMLTLLYFIDNCNCCIYHGLSLVSKLGLHFLAKSE